MLNKTAIVEEPKAVYTEPFLSVWQLSFAAHRQLDLGNVPHHTCMQHFYCLPISKEDSPRTWLDNTGITLHTACERKNSWAKKLWGFFKLCIVFKVSGSNTSWNMIFAIYIIYKLWKLKSTVSSKRIVGQELGNLATYAMQYVNCMGATYLKFGCPFEAMSRSIVPLVANTMNDRYVKLKC